jgi:hypothetical protein
MTIDLRIVGLRALLEALDRAGERPEPATGVAVVGGWRSFRRCADAPLVRLTDRGCPAPARSSVTARMSAFADDVPLAFA